MKINFPGDESKEREKWEQERKPEQNLLNSHWILKSLCAVQNLLKKNCKELTWKLCCKKNQTV